MSLKITYKDGKEENFDGYDSWENEETFVELTDSEDDSKNTIYIAKDLIARIE